MKLAIFDIDGTLIDSNAIDNACFIDTFQTAFGSSAASVDWSDYRHHTDRGLTEEFLRRAWRREPLEAEIARHRDAFVSALRARVDRLEEIRGARAFIEYLLARDWSVALATGAWSESALLKLAAAGLPPALPLACCDQCASREDILLRAIGGRKPERIVVFGDGWWDVRAARNLGLPFIGVGNPAGATEVIADFGDPDAVLAAMMRVSRP
jgi:beta-phosphoglucomutase-like phosphatase (HAD superfamily)